MILGNRIRTVRIIVKFLHELKTPIKVVFSPYTRPDRFVKADDVWEIRHSKDAPYYYYNNYGTRIGQVLEGDLYYLWRPCTKQERLTEAYEQFKI